jgi:hypothetical protein
VPGEILPLRASCHWTDPTTDYRHRWDISPSPLERATAQEVAATEPDQLVAERAALQRAAAERRAGLELDRAGRYRESRLRMEQSVAYLRAAPQSLEVNLEISESLGFANMPASAPIDNHQRKAAQMREHQRRHGRPTEPTTGSDR